MDRSRLLDLNEAVQHPGRNLEFDLELEGFDEPELALVEPVSGRLSAQCDGRVLFLKGSFHTVAVLECVRCTTDVETEVRFLVEEAFPIIGIPSAYSHGGGAYVDDKDEPYPLFVENRLKIEDLVRQLLIVALPMHPLCSEECHGLCDHCGANLNEGPCGCVRESSHPAFRALAEEWPEI